VRNVKGLIGGQPNVALSVAWVANGLSRGL